MWCLIISVWELGIRAIFIAWQINYWFIFVFTIFIFKGGTIFFNYWLTTLTVIFVFMPGKLVIFKLIQYPASIFRYHQQYPPVYTPKPWFIPISNRAITVVQLFPPASSFKVGFFSYYS
jgi:hypothetical protein